MSHKNLAQAPQVSQEAQADLARFLALVGKPLQLQAWLKTLSLERCQALIDAHAQHLLAEAQ
jgi:hypothetical protein